MGKGNPYHDPKTGEFTSGPGGMSQFTVHDDGLVTVMPAGPPERGVKLPPMTVTERASVRKIKLKPTGKFVGDY